ncbi:MAG: hypothetical protein IJL09_08525 [Lachnospiraceae bacterium]|nr:hypothetical protein [Lachnospiraceae bacterium]
MRELGRVFHRKMIWILAVLCVMNLILFLLSIDPEKTITSSGEELDLYLQQYPVFLKNTVDNGRKMGMLSMYKKGYASESLKKTTELYRGLEGTTVKAGDNRGIVLLVDYQLTDLFLLVFLFLIVMEFQAERKKGLVYLVRSTARGRSLLFACRIGILAFATVVGALVFYGANLVGVLCGFGVDDLGRSLQSLPEFMKCPYQITIGGYLVRALFLKMAGCFTAALLFYALVGCLNSILAYVISGLLIVGEVLAGLFIQTVSSWNWLRYVNFFTLIRCEDYYKDAVFINVFGKAREALPTTLVLFGILFALTLVFGYVILGRKYVMTSHLGERLFDLVARFRERFAMQHTLIGWEAYKLLWKQKGFLVLAAVFLVHLGLSAKYEYYCPVDIYQRMYYIEYAGEVTPERVERAETSLEILKMSEAGLEKRLAEMEAAENPQWDLIVGIQQSLETTRWKQMGLTPILEDLRSALAYEEKTGHEISLVAPFYYDLLLNRDEKTKTRASFLILTALLASLAGVFAFDRQNHMNEIMHSSYRGRRETSGIKTFLVLLFSAVSCAALHLVQLWRVARVDTGLPDLKTPVQGILFLRDFPIYMPIWVFLLFWFLVRVAAACVVGLIILLISRKSGDVITAMGVSCFLMILLVLFGELAPSLWWLSPIQLLNGTYFR